MGNIWSYRGSWYYSFGQAASYRGPLVIEIISTSGEIFISDGYVVLHFDDGTNLQICIPDLTIPDVYAIAFFVTEDGSTYYTELTRDAIPAIQYDMDTYYATRWEPQNLAAGAYDHRVARLGSSLAKSPAVDAGSLDFLSGATTKSQHTGYPLASSYQDHVAASSETAPDSPTVLTDSLSHPLDLGYHYGAALQSSKYITLRNPKDSIGSFTYGTYNLNPIYSNQDEGELIAIASGNYDQTALNKDKTIICFVTNRVDTGTEGNPFYHQFVGYKRFRDPNINIAVELQSQDYYDVEFYPSPIKGHPNIKHISMTTSEESSGSEAETIYMGISTEIEAQDPPYPYHIIKHNLQIFRYDSQWVKVGECTTDIDEYGFIYDIEDLCISAYEDDLVVCWVNTNRDIEDVEDPVYELVGYRIDNAATRTSVDTISPYFIKYLDTYYEETRLSSEWDPDQYVNRPRISWNEKDLSSVYQIHAAQVTFLGGQPNGVYQDYVISLDSYPSQNIYDAKYPTISVNRYQKTQFNDPNTNEAFNVFKKSDGSSTYLRKATLQSSGGIDTWSLISNPVGETLIPGSITYRSFGTDKSVYVQYNTLKITTGDLSLPYEFIKPPKITTNRKNKADIFTTFYTYQEIMIIGVNP